MGADGIWFFQLEKTWIAVKPIALGDYYAVDNGMDRYADELFFHAPITGAHYGGLAMEVGDGIEGWRGELHLRRSGLQGADLGPGTVPAIGNALVEAFPHGWAESECGVPVGPIASQSIR